MAPIESRPRIGFAARGDISVSNHIDERISSAQHGRELGQTLVLGGSVGPIIHSLELDAY